MCLHCVNSASDWWFSSEGGGLYFSKMSQFQLFISIFYSISFIRNVWNSKMSRSEGGGVNIYKKCLKFKSVLITSQSKIWRTIFYQICIYLEGLGWAVTSSTPASLNFCWVTCHLGYLLSISSFIFIFNSQNPNWTTTQPKSGMTWTWLSILVL